MRRDPRYLTCDDVKDLLMKRKREDGWDEVKLRQKDSGTGLHMYQARAIYDAWQTLC